MTFGRYTLIRRIAVGGMAEIWKAKVVGAAGFQKTVAIKRVLPHLVQDAEFIEMFIEEAKLVAELVHPNIVQVFDFGQAGPGEYFIAMEFVPGANIGALHKRSIEKGGRIPPGIALYIAAEASKGLGFAHSRTDESGKPLNLVHRDVSPQNILASFGGDVKVGDFGIAKAASASSRTQEGHIRGKLAYMSPEQANAKPLDGRADLFSLGIVLFELLAGRKLFGAPSTAEIYARVAGYRALLPQDLQPVHESLRPVLVRALDPDPDRRFQTGQEMETALTAILTTDGLVRARTGLASMMQSLFDEERKAELTPTSLEPATLAGVAPADLSGEGGMAVVGGIDRDRSTSIVPPTPSQPTLNPSRVSVQPLADTLPRAKRPLALWGAIAGGLGMAAIIGGLGVKVLSGTQGTPAPTPIALATATPQLAVTVTVTPVATAAQATPTRIARVTPAPTAIVVATPAPTRAPSGKAGTLSVTSRPWVQVWVDGRKVKDETPLTDHKLSAGTHTLRFVNAGQGFDQSKTIQVPGGGEVTVHVDVRKKTISVR